MISIPFVLCGCLSPAGFMCIFGRKWVCVWWIFMQFCIQIKTFCLQFHTVLDSGPKAFRTHTRTHIHLPSATRTTNSQFVMASALSEITNKLNECLYAPVYRNVQNRAAAVAATDLNARTHQKPTESKTWFQTPSLNKHLPMNTHKHT